MWIIITASVVLIVLVIAAVSYRPLSKIYREVELERASGSFKACQEQLEAKFFDLAGASGKPKGLKWEHCEFHSPACFARDKKSGRLCAFLEMTISFSAIEGGGMEHVEAVGNHRHASAVFHYHRGRWMTVGRALFNMNPAEAIAHLEQQFEPVFQTDANA